VILAALLLQLAATPPATIPNPGFERGLEGWAPAGHRGFRAGIGSDYPANGRHWLHMGWAARNRTPGDADFQVSTTIDARRYRGRRIRISVETKVRNGRDSGANILFVSAGTAHARMALLESDAWQRQSVTLAVPRSAGTITLGFRIENAGGGIEADNVRLEILR
jgi:hypothetical protein